MDDAHGRTNCTTPPHSPASDGSLPYSWDTEFALLTDRFVLYDGVKLWAWTYLLIAALFSTVLLVQGEPELVLPMLRAFAFAAGGLAFLGILVMLVVFRNRFQARVTVSADGVLMESTSRAGKVGNRLAVVLGALGRSPRTAGAGLLGMSQESVGLTWGELRRVKAHDDHYVISLMNSWRVVMRLYCTPENYATVLALVTGASGRRADGSTSLPEALPGDEPAPERLSGNRTSGKGARRRS